MRCPYLSRQDTPGIVERPYFVGIKHNMLPLLVDVILMVCCNELTAADAR